jgi:hypothetical protein
MQFRGIELNKGHGVANGLGVLGSGRKLLPKAFSSTDKVYARVVLGVFF